MSRFLKSGLNRHCCMCSYPSFEPITRERGSRERFRRSGDHISHVCRLYAGFLRVQRRTAPMYGLNLSERGLALSGLTRPGISSLHPLLHRTRQFNTSFILLLSPYAVSGFLSLVTKARIYLYGPLERLLSRTKRLPLLGAHILLDPAVTPTEYPTLSSFARC